MSTEIRRPPLTGEGKTYELYVGSCENNDVGLLVIQVMDFLVDRKVIPPLHVDLHYPVQGVYWLAEYRGVPIGHNLFLRVRRSRTWIQGDPAEGTAGRYECHGLSLIFKMRRPDDKWAYRICKGTELKEHGVWAFTEKDLEIVAKKAKKASTEMYKLMQADARTASAITHVLKSASRDMRDVDFGYHHDCPGSRVLIEFPVDTLKQAKAMAKFMKSYLPTVEQRTKGYRQRLRR